MTGTTLAGVGVMGAALAGVRSEGFGVTGALASLRLLLWDQNAASQRRRATQGSPGLGLPPAGTMGGAECSVPLSLQKSPKGDYHPEARIICLQFLSLSSMKIVSIKVLCYKNLCQFYPIRPILLQLFFSGSFLVSA